MRTAHRRISATALAVLVLVTSACAPRSTAPGGSAADAQQVQAPAAPKILTIGRMREPAYIEGFIGGVSFAGEVRDFVHSYLTVQNYRDETVAQLAAELPATDRGTWLVKPDGSMDVTWKL